MGNHFLDLFAFFLFLRASSMDSKIWAKARLRVLGERGASEEDDEDDEEDVRRRLIFRPNHAFTIRRKTRHARPDQSVARQYKNSGLCTDCTRRAERWGNT
jgi:hypothetical protein